MATYGDYECVIGLEVHAQLLTRTKAFCGCKTSFGEPPNTHTCPVCLGLPGALPVLNAEAVRMAVAAARALGCAVQRSSVFARKNYFYPDLPKGYQISQYDQPLALHGFLDFELDGQARRPRILRVHMEEDAGKNLHGVQGDSIVDLNRAGTPLIEIVGEPDLRSPAEAAEYLKRLREVLMFIGVNDGNLEQGSFRCDANVSVRKIGDEKLGTRTELKNINSFRFVADAIEVEIRRQIALLGRGEPVRQQTRGYNSEKRTTYTLRDKEGEAGYRYFPEPDLPPLVLEEAYVEEIARSSPRGPKELREAFVKFGLTPSAASVLTSHPKISALFEETDALFAEGEKQSVKVANFIQSEVLRDVKTRGLEADIPIGSAHLAALLRLAVSGRISGAQLKEVYAGIRGTDESPEAFVTKKGMFVMSDAGELEAMARALLDANPKHVASYRAGKVALLGFFVGQMMKQTAGKADPARVSAIVKKLLDEAASGATPVSKTVPGPTPAPPRIIALAGPPAGAIRPSTTLRSIVTAEPPSAPSGEPKVEPELVTFDAFARLDLRVGLITAAARVPKKDKLLDLRVDTGDAEPRRIVAGLALSFSPEELVGKRVVVVCNLEPRAFSKDLVSHGMILASGPSDGLALTTLSRELPPGTRVK